MYMWALRVELEHCINMGQNDFFALIHSTMVGKYFVKISEKDHY